MKRAFFEIEQYDGDKPSEPMTVTISGGVAQEVTTEQAAERCCEWLRENFDTVLRSSQDPDELHEMSGVFRCGTNSVRLWFKVSSFYGQFSINDGPKQLRVTRLFDQEVPF